MPGGSTSLTSSTPPLSAKRSPPKRSTPSPSSPASQTALITQTTQRIKPENPSPLITTNGSPDSSMSGSNDMSKRRRYTSSPVRPWKSPPSHSSDTSSTLCTLNTSNTSSTRPNSASASASASNILRHISVIRETPPILKPQVVAPSYHTHPHTAHYHHHHHHHLVDPYTAYHLYKNGGAPGTGMTTATASPGSASVPPHNWGAYN